MESDLPSSNYQQQNGQESLVSILGGIQVIFVMAVFMISGIVLIGNIVFGATPWF